MNGVVCGGADVSSSRRKNRKRHYTAPSHVRQWKMGVRLSKALCREYGVPRLSIPIHKDDVVRVMTGKFKDEPPSKVVRVHRKKYRLFIENIQREKANGMRWHGMAPFDDEAFTHYPPCWLRVVQVLRSKCPSRTQTA